MMISNQEQLLLLFRCLGCGVWLGLLWEIIGVIRHCIKLQKPFLFLMDVIGTIASGFILFLFALAVNSGELRAVMLAAIGAGMFIVHTTFGRLLRILVHKTQPFRHAVYTFWECCLQRGALLCKKSGKKVVFFYKKGLQYIHPRVYNRNNK